MRVLKKFQGPPRCKVNTSTSSSLGLFCFKAWMVVAVEKGSWICSEAHESSESLAEQELNTVVVLAEEKLSCSATFWLLLPTSEKLNTPPSWSQSLLFGLPVIETSLLNIALKILEHCGIPFPLMFRSQLADLFKSLLELPWQQLKPPSEVKFFFRHPLSRR